MREPSLRPIVREWAASRRFAPALGVLAGALVALACSRKEGTEQKTAPSADVGASSTALPSGGAAASASSAPAAAGNPPAPEAEALPEEPEIEPTTLDEQKKALLERMRVALKLGDDELERVRAIYFASKPLSQGNPDVTKHPMTRAECRAVRRKHPELPAGDARCGKPNMVALYDPKAGEGVEQAKVCIDQYEFPNIPCEYPVVYARASEAVALCNALGKRICDAHEWEGACAGAVLAPEVEYPFGERRLMMEYLHNKNREIVWSYGAEKDHLKCATTSRKSPKCIAGGWTLCGSNTFPAGAFPECRSRFGAFDLHGNAAEHMNLPLLPEQLASRGGLGETEMKGSWFIFAKGEAHLDDCRWRAPQWHKTRIDDQNSHSNYHLGFRCCKDI